MKTVITIMNTLTKHLLQETPFANLDQETQAKIQQMQMMEQAFQQLLMQKNNFSFELSETEKIIAETEKAEGEVMRIIGNQVVIKSAKEKILEEMKEKKEMVEARMKDIDSQEKEYSEQMNSLREEIMKKIQG